MKRILVMGATLAAAGVVAGVASAETVGVSRCDSQIDGGYFAPGLMTVDASGNRQFFPVGENDLTEAIVFERALAFAWVEAQGLFPEGTVFTDYDGYICGVASEDAGNRGGNDAGTDSDSDGDDTSTDPDDDGSDDGDDRGNRNQNENRNENRNTGG
ncbi:hypothetical protein P6F26_12280 [Roseibacterium sp. SDUM158017]|uniref:hypothetical protein n=1 Tax=Roseicyclus salinarum TaxID=3036773 RepID=UPI00241564D5|nr:hypothetical protein [Roseibacterium sp. SDUM158017]MDG4649225.1 hypothetical protein [Roseibacterium sp. SDUM158017]